MQTQMHRFGVTLLFLSVALTAGVTTLRADQAALSDGQRIENLEKENAELRRRLDLVEEAGAQDKYVPKESIPEKTMEFLGQTEISGYVSASYFFNFNEPPLTTDSSVPPEKIGRLNTGRGFDNRHNEFMINKFLLKFEKPVEASAFDWKAGYVAETIFGQDAGFTQASGLSLGDQGDLLQAYVIVNVPIGNGLMVTFGKCSTPLGYELTETELNYNWSGGNQWTFLEPFTHTGVQISYQINEQWDAQLLVNNGWDNVADNNNAKSFIGRVGYAPNEKTSISVTGFGGPEQDEAGAAAVAGANGNWRRGADVVVTHQCTEHFQTAVQLDYGHEENVPGAGPDAEWYAAGLWLIYEPSEKWNVAFRGDWLKDADGVRTGGSPATAPFTLAGIGQELISATVTLNFKPVKELRISPEVRWDRSTDNTVFDGHDNQVTLGIGAAYFF